MKNKQAAQDKIVENNYLINYIKDVYAVNQMLGGELMILNNDSIGVQIKNAEKSEKPKK